jgi:hypothetical protein
MGDAGVASLADALHTNNTLKKLSIHQNDAITEDGLKCFVEAVSRHTGLVRLFIPFHSGVDKEKLKNTISEARKRNGLQPGHCYNELTRIFHWRASYNIIIILPFTKIGVILITQETAYIQYQNALSHWTG